MKNQKQLALALLDYHGGQNSALYAIGSCMLSDSENGRKYFWPLDTKTFLAYCRNSLAVN